MNRFVSYTTLLALAASTPVLFADLSAQVPAAAPAAARGNCDLLASNTVRATFVGMHDLAVQTINDAAPTTAQVAVFEVIDLLGYKKYNRLGDGQLTSGTKFTVAMSKELPGQPADIVDTISQMQPGEEAVLKIDHLYLMNGAQGEPLRVCSRMARRAVQPAVTTTENAPTPTADSAEQTPAPLPDKLAPLGGAAAATGAGNVQFSASSTSVSVTRDASGQIVQTRTESKFDPASGQVKTRMFINGTEVDPQTRQPLAQPAATPAPAAETAPTPAADKPAEEPKPAEAPKSEEHGDDTVVEHVDAPAPQPAPEAAAPAAPAPAPAAEEGEGF